MPRSLCSEVNRMVTCLEATEMGYSFIQTCSKCDYYLQNRALNAKALKLPRSELSAMWQCTAKHKVGDLNCHDGNNTPYQPAPVMKYNSFLCSLTMMQEELILLKLVVVSECDYLRRHLLLNAVNESLFHQPQL